MHQYETTYIAFQFSASVEDGLKTGKLTNNMQNEFIRDVCTAILNYTRHPSKAERIQVARLIVKQYPCMGDRKILENSSDWVCLLFTPFSFYLSSPSIVTTINSGKEHDFWFT